VKGYYDQALVALAVAEGMVTEHERELEALVDLLARVSEETATLGTAHADVRRKALGLAFKLTGHAASALTLLRDKSALVPDGPRFLDGPSVFVLARAGWEAFLLLHWIFVAPGEDDQERQLRYRRWSIESVRKRQQFDTLLDGQKEQLAEERQLIEKTLAEIQANPAFLKRSGAEQKELLRERGKWRPSFRDMAKGARIAKLFAEDHYSYLCDHAHTGWFSVESLKGSLSAEDERMLRQTVAISLGIATANVVAGLQTLFQNVSVITDLDARRVEHWVAQGQGRVEQAAPA
jgi:hypothetical protein